MGSMDRRCFLKHCGRCAIFLAGVEMLDTLGFDGDALAQGLQKGLVHRKLSPYFTPLGGGRWGGPGDGGMGEPRSSAMG